MSAASPEPRYPYVLVDVPEAEAEEAGVRLFELGATGVEQRDATTLTRAAAGRALLAASFAGDAEARAAHGELPPAWSARVEHVVGDAWRDEWKKYFEPFRLCDGIVVRPPWRAYEAAAGERVVQLEPGRAFGTGLHETTRLAARALAERPSAVRGAEVLDVGCGSGILALAALALGARTARCIDVDPEAVSVTIENAARNGAADRVTADATPLDAVPGRFPVAVANIDAKTLCAIAPSLTARIAPGGLLVVSGILAPCAGPGAAGADPEGWREVRGAYEALALEETKTLGEWLAAVFRATSRAGA